MLSNGICSGRTRFLSRTSCGSIPASRAIASSTSSSAKHTPVRATPRYGRIGHVFAAVFDPAHRVAAMHGKPAETNFFGQQDAFVAEPPADVGRDDADLTLFE